MSPVSSSSEVCTMTLFGYRRTVNAKPPQGDTTVRPCLELLEDRVAPAVIGTTTNVAISISPNLLSLTAVETITATVTQQDTNGMPVSVGSVVFNVNNQQGTVPLNSNGQASFTATLPLFAVATNQTVLASYGSTIIGPPTVNLLFVGSQFLSPVYLNMFNEVFPSQVTFGTQPNGTFSPGISFNSASGETNAVTVFFLPVDFNYIDPGRIQSITIGGFTLPGSFSSVFGIQQLG
jgi:hypothetical protein